MQAAHPPGIGLTVVLSGHNVLKELPTSHPAGKADRGHGFWRPHPQPLCQLLHVITSVTPRLPPPQPHSHCPLGQLTQGHTWHPYTEPHAYSKALALLRKQAKLLGLAKQPC